MASVTAPIAASAKPVFFKRTFFSSTHVFQPLCNRETEGEDFLRGKGAKEKFVNFLKDIKNDPNPFTFHAKDINGKSLKGLHTKDTVAGKTFRLFRTSLVFVGLASLAVAGIASIFTPIPLPITIATLVLSIGIPLMIDGAYLKDKIVARRAQKKENQLDNLNNISSVNKVPLNRGNTPLKAGKIYLDEAKVKLRKGWANLDKGGADLDKDDARLYKRKRGWSVA